MAKTSPVILIEHDNDDRELFQEIFTELGFKNQLRFFYTSLEALSYLEKTKEKAFLIISNINLPGMSGIDLKKAINDNEALRKKAVPFIYTTAADKSIVNKAFFDMTVQGYFIKENSTAKIKSTIKIIVDYWYLCKHPNSE
jgi:CheY-like chemotaxis protein